MSDFTKLLKQVNDSYEAARSAQADAEVTAAHHKQQYTELLGMLELLADAVPKSFQQVGTHFVISTQQMTDLHQRTKLARALIKEHSEQTPD